MNQAEGVQGHSGMNCQVWGPRRVGVLFTANGGAPLPSKEGTPSTFQGLSPESQGQNLALTVVYVPYSLDSGLWQTAAGSTAVGGKTHDATGVGKAAPRHTVGYDPFLKSQLAPRESL